ncbi:MAG: hypothetical protein UU24_C0003G0020 [Candidatus Nomurabacteria bacterium GW2011_GWA2_40_9]|uniref:Transglycosylase SLT domain-containing protein n=1 Tax=Candidatus Nomurabacteria bacterium GW2011_GWA2_40_9 TaxID=1618734 RepID=A0A0G0W694_9BACT|nr:MAG: hypothetical protein UU24_C0003G0020 [Candidatus Nomurabacteria bacterium GW2011_GWA2_40_9]
MQISNITKKISLTLFALFLAFSFFSTSFAMGPWGGGTSSSVEIWSFHWKSHPPQLLSEGTPTFPYQVECEIAQGAKEAEGFDIVSPCSLQLAGGAEASVSTDTTYTFLEKLPGFDDTFDSTKKCSFVDYLNIMIKLLIGIGAVLAMVMIVMGGMEYMTSELISSKEAGKDRIKNAMLGLVIALSAYLILNTLNPNLLDLCLDNLPRAEISITPEETLRNRSGSGICTPVTNGPCSPTSLASAFPGNSNFAPAPFNTIAGQASSICNLESHGIASTLSGVDKCADGKAFSFGLFQINGSAHRSSIPACANAFNIPAGHGNSQGNHISGGYSWTCTTVEPAYTQCKNFLLNPANNIAYAAQLKGSGGWGPWSTYQSCNDPGEF